MKFQFDSEQPFQQEAMAAVVDLFDGQPLNQGDFSISFDSLGREGELAFGGQVQAELGIGNGLMLSRETLLKNLQAVQERNDLDPDATLLPAALDENAPAPLNFSVEMETGTGKTYVYLRTIFELQKKYGFKKYIIVVPSVAIREGVLKNLEITAEHFRALYNNVAVEHFVYDSKKVNRLRSFALSNSIQILVINIDAFRKNFTGTENERKSNVIYTERDGLNGRRPIEFVQATNPIVIIDEPQSVDGTEKAQEAIRALNPFCTLRYSATHKNPYNLVYSLNPIRAFTLGLVKQIVVASVTGDEAQNDAYVKLLAVDNKKGITASVEIDVQTGDGPKRKRVKVGNNSDLYTLSNERENYRAGFDITEINASPGEEFIQFSNGQALALGGEIGGVRGDIWKAQIKNTIRRHLDKELALRGRGIKVLSLFFIDRVANYRSYDESGNAVQGKFAETFEAAFAELTAMPKYKGLLTHPVEQLHNGYFAQDKKGALKDTSGTTQADDDVYNLIMRDKERLLSLDEPLRFIFSHSALREGWDNPNVFQICTLNETHSSMKKRQEIGRGLRLPVNQDGVRIFDQNINQLLVVANESYESFARTLQKEYEDDCGVTFGKVPKTAFSKLVRQVEGEAIPLGRDESKALFAALIEKKMIDESGRLLPAFAPKAPGFTLDLPPAFFELEKDVVEVLRNYQTTQIIKKDEEGKKLLFKKAVSLDPQFEELWKRISPKTTYSVEYDTETLVANAVKALKAMERINPVKIHIQENAISMSGGGIGGTIVREVNETASFRSIVPDLLAYLQAETELTRSTLVRILKESGRLAEFLVNPQKFMDAVAALINRELHRLIIDGIKYERIAGEEYSMRLFEEEEIVSYLNNRLDVKNSIYDAVVYDSEVERDFAKALDDRQDIKLFVKLPRWFKIETPLGTYNPDWAIVREEQDTTLFLYLVRETKGTKDFAKLRTIEADKIRCGQRHFETLKVDFKVATSISDLG